MVQRGAQEGMGMDLPSDEGECKGGRSITVGLGVGYGEKSTVSLGEHTHREANSSFSANGCAQLIRGFTGDEDRATSAQSDHATRRRADKGDVEVDRMEFEGGGEVAATF